MVIPKYFKKWIYSEETLIKRETYSRKAMEELAFRAYKFGRKQILDRNKKHGNTKT